jgi:Bax protein
MNKHPHLKIKAALRDLPASLRLDRARRFGLGAFAAIALLAMAIIVSSNLNRMPDMKSIDDAVARKATFFGYLEPIAETLNQKILQQRARLLEIATSYQHDQDLSLLDQLRLKSMAQQYAVDWHESDPAEVIARLERRIDMVPVSLVLVQAAKESGWGTSRFAREGNNLFGQWCYSEGCGIVPAKRPQGAKHEVRVFDSVQEAIGAYLHNINTGDAYASLREIRARQRNAGKTPNGKILADGLLHYSQRREAYVREVKAMLDQYHKFQQQKG